ncbi:MAG TPA: glycosyltransferase family 1 protein [Candidatus Woesebacteria bacterium]|nr:glycosyltransferase family 1 protein [Candidatus Woesebacteria bacterium]
MIIGIDGNEANVEKKVGVSVYTLKLLEYFQKIASEETQFKIFLRNPPLSFLPKKNDFFTYEVVPAKILWSQIFLPIHLYFKTQIDVYFAPAHYAPRYCPFPIVVTIHDLSFFYFPNEFKKKDLFQLKNWTSYSLEIASSIIAVSKTTKKDIRHFYDLPENRIHVVYNGFEKHVDKAKSTIMEDLNLQKNKFLLYVGTLQPRKNITILIKSFKLFQQKNPDYKLVLVGKKGWLYDSIFAEVNNQNLTNSVIFTDYIPDADVSELYKNALCFVMPSLYEGFGIPILEAMAHNCPVISSHTSSLPEIGGDACLYFDAKDEKDLLQDIERLAEDSDLRRKLIQKGKERITEFSWEKSAKETLEILKNTIN